MSRIRRVAIVGAVLAALTAVLPAAAFARSPAPAVRVLAISYGHTMVSLGVPT